MQALESEWASREDAIILESGVILLPIPDYAKSEYRAGSDGKIYSSRKRVVSRAAIGAKWGQMKFRYGTKGYPRVCIFAKGKSSRFSENVHRLVCAAFHGPPPPSEDRMEVRHLDGDRTNSLPGNLAWGTRADNWLDRKIHGRGIEGEKNPTSKITNEERAHLRWAFENNLCTQKHAAKALGLPLNIIQRACNYEPFDPVVANEQLEAKAVLSKSILENWGKPMVDEPREPVIHDPCEGF